MVTAWQVLPPMLLIATLSLVIPLAIVLGHRHPTRALLLSGGGSLVAFSALWLVFDGSSLLDGPNSSPQGDAAGGMVTRAIMIALGTLLLLAAWTLALNAAAQARRWDWMVALVLAGFLSFAAVVAVLVLRDACPAGPPEAGFGPCALTPPAQLPIMAGTLAGPAVVLVYWLRPRGLWRAGLPEGLIASRLGAAGDAEGAEGAESAESAGGPARHSDWDLRADRADQ